MSAAAPGSGAAGATADCRVCGRPLFGEALLRFDKMPKAAQHLPRREELAGDRGVDLAVCQCSACGLVQLGNAPVPYYREVIRAAAVSAQMRDFRRRQFAAFVARYQLAGEKVLEVGCGSGEYLGLLQEAGVVACGLEAGASGVAACRSAGLTVEEGFIADGDCVLEQAPFAAFAILNFFEHVPDPAGLLAGVRRNLHPGAVGLVEVPNFEMILRRRLFSEFIGDHLFYFTAPTLSATLQMNGFEVLECRPIWHDYILSATVVARERLDLCDFRREQAELARQLDAFLARFPAGQVAIWGAGHQALAVMALAQLEGRIRYVVDSAPFKQGRYTPATHLPIVAPQALRDDPVAAVIVMAASYSEEVVALLRRDYDPRLSLAALRQDGLEVVRP